MLLLHFLTYRQIVLAKAKEILQGPNSKGLAIPYPHCIITPKKAPISGEGGGTYFESILGALSQTGRYGGCRSQLGKWIPIICSNTPVLYTTTA